MGKQIAWVDYGPPVYVVVFARYFIVLLWQPNWSSYDEPDLGRQSLSFDNPRIPHPHPHPRHFVDDCWPKMWYIHGHQIIDR